jgi:hypothetical protein
MADPQNDIPPGSVSRPDAGSKTPSEQLAVTARQLTGDLWCIGCGYNLRGLSIRERCPECGMPVRATILGVVDPKAHELAPLFRPALTGAGLIAWSIGAWVAVVSVATMRGAEILRVLFSVSWWPGWAPFLGTLGLMVSGLGAMVLIRPHARVSRLGAIRAACGVAAYIPLTLMYFHVYARLDRSSPAPFLQPGPLEFERAMLRLGMFIFVALVILGLREHGRSLATRSVVVRTGRVDRQSMLALLAVFAVAAGGDALHVLSAALDNGVADLTITVGTVLLAVGSVLVVVGVSNVVLDTWRLWPVIVRPGVGLGDVLESNEMRAERVDQTAD